MEGIAASLARLADGGDIRQLLIEELGFDYADESVFFELEHTHLESAFPSVRNVAEKNGLPVIHLQSSETGKLGKQLERESIQRLKARYPLAWFIFSDASGHLWHFVNVKKEATESGSGAGRVVLRRMEIAPEVTGRLRTTVERLAMIRDGLPGCSNASEVQSLLDKGFDVEAIGKNFFAGYKDHFWQLVDAIIESNKGKSWFMGDEGESNARHYAMLLMGRILFLHFIQCKNWLNGEQDFLASRLAGYRDDPDNSGFLWEMLFPLFFEGLAKPGDETRIGNETCHIPFLNGGLFEPNEDFSEADDIQRPLIPNRLFLDFFAFLGRYNFTIAESTPLDQEVSVDPEMLGKVFENLLAKDDRHATGTYYTPRTIVSFMCRESLFQYLHRKAGLDRAQFHALLDHVWHGEAEGVDEDLCRRVLDALESIKVLDPAIGSGAFPLGMLHELVEFQIACRRLLGESEESLLAGMARLKTDTIERSLFGVDINVEACEIARLRLWLAMVVDEDKPTPLPNLDYHIVQGDTLREKLDGEPILPPRIEKKDTDLTESQTALPGLGTSQLTLGTTSGTRAQHTVDIIRALHAYYEACAGEEKRRLKSEIEAGLMAILNEHWDEKEKHFKSDEKDVWEIINRAGKERTSLPGKWQKKISAAEEGLKRIKAEREALEKDGRWPVTPLRLFFADVFAGSNPGFDIVIANPPYIRIQEMRGQLGSIVDGYNAEYRSATGNYDIYVLFVEQGLALLNHSGALCYIMPNKFHNADYGKGLRHLISQGQYLVGIVDFLRNQPFEATTYTHILHLIRSGSDAFRVARFGRELHREEFQAGGIIARDLEALLNDEPTQEASMASFSAEFVSDAPWTLPTGKKAALLGRLLAIRSTLSEVTEGIFQGLVTSADPIYILEHVEDLPNDLVHVRRPAGKHKGTKTIVPEWEGEMERAMLKPFFKNGVVDAYYLSPPKHWLIFPYDLSGSSPRLFTGEEIRPQAPRTWSYLSEELNQHILRAREKGKMDHDGWWAYVYPKNLDKFEGEKLSILAFSTRGRFTYDSGSLYYTGRGDSGYGIRLREDADISYFSLQAILNSPIVTFFLANTSAPFRGGYFSFGKRFIERLPIVLPDNETQQKLDVLVDQIARLKKQWHESDQPDDVAHQIEELDSSINNIVFDLYGLTDTERGLVLSASSPVTVAE